MNEIDAPASDENATQSNVPTLIQFYDKNSYPSVINKTPGKAPQDFAATTTCVATPEAAPRPPASARLGSTLGAAPLPTPFSPSSTSFATSAREAAKLAKVQSTTERIRRVTHLKEKWAKEKGEKILRNKNKKVTDLRKVQDENTAAAAARKKMLDAQKSYADREKEEQRELLSASVECRAQLAKDMDAKSKAKRRISVFLNNSIRKQAVAKEEMLRRAEKDRVQFDLDLRRTDVLQNRSAKMADDIKRRESMAGRGVASKMQREVELQMIAEEKDEVSELMKTRHMNWEDDRHGKQTADQMRRMSVAGRLDEWRDQKKVSEQTLHSQKQFDKNLLHTQKLDHDDVLGYKKDLVKRDRMSLAGRLQKWREERVDPGIQFAADAIERELQQCAYEDVQEYKLTLRAQRRESVAFRLDKAKEDKTFEAGQKAIAKVVHDEEQRLHDYDFQDVNNYRKGLQEARRQSLHYRNVKEVQRPMPQYLSTSHVILTFFLLTFHSLRIGSAPRTWRCLRRTSRLPIVA
jgi:hypothetical protein